MRSILTRKFFGAIRFKRFGFVRDERGQGILEYVLVLVVVLGVVFMAARPLIASMQKSVEKSLKGGMFKEDPTGSNFYYFPVK